MVKEIEYAVVVLVESRHFVDGEEDARENSEIFRVEVDQVPDVLLAERIAAKLALAICMVQDTDPQ